MESQEINKQLNMSYEDLLIYWKDKYGRAPENYYLDVNCTRKSVKNIRSAEGLAIHHDKEYDPANPLAANLCDTELAKIFDYSYQYAENLSYVNYLEHLIAHCKINLLRKAQLGRYINDSVILKMVPRLNDWYRYKVKLQPYQEIAFKLIEDNYSDYCDIIEWWLKELGVEDVDWKKYTQLK